MFSPQKTKQLDSFHYDQTAKKLTRLQMHVSQRNCGIIHPVVADTWKEIYVYLQIIIWTQYFTDIPLVVMGCKWFTYKRRSTSIIVRLDFFLWGNLKRLKLLTSSESLSEIVRGKGASKIDRMIWGRLMDHICETPVETERV